jgi:sugar/nucleoside kinase (ribokinase family)
VSVRQVVVVGDVMLDVVVRPEGPLAPTSDTPSRIRVARGGSGANVAVALRASGHRVYYVGAAGDDAARDSFVASLDESDVASSIEVVSRSTGTVVVLVAEDGQRMMLTDRGANQLLSEDFVAEHLEVPFDHLHVSGYLLLDLATRNLAEHTLMKAQEFGRSTSIDVCSVGPLLDVTPEVFLRAASYASQLFANEEEALALTSTDDVESALEMLATRFSEVIITKGARGAIGARGDERFRAEGLGVEVVDTTGAGDAATGTYLGARLHGERPSEALANAMVAASSVVGTLGARD